MFERNEVSRCGMQFLYAILCSDTRSNGEATRAKQARAGSCGKRAMYCLPHARVADRCPIQNEQNSVPWSIDHIV